MPHGLAVAAVPMPYQFPDAIVRMTTVVHSLPSYMRPRLTGGDFNSDLSASSRTLRGHPFMTSTRRGEGVRLRWTHVDGGRGSRAMWTSTQKIKIRVH